jgi:hypothetical protein
MMHADGIARLGMLAMGLGIAGALAGSSGIAVADSSGLDIQVSIDGTDLFSTTGNSATATSGTGDFAIAIGDGASANANGGTGDFALADGSDAVAKAGGLSTDTGANGDTAIDIGTNSGTLNGAWAGNGDLLGLGLPQPGAGSGDTAIDIGNNDGGFLNGAFAGAGGLLGSQGDGNNDTAIDIGNNTANSDATAAYDGAEADGGNGNYASELGNTAGLAEGANADFGNDNTAVSNTSYTESGAGTVAESGDNNYAYVDGPDNSTAFAGEGNSDIAYVLDPFGSTASTAVSGFGGNSDLAAVLLTDGNANAATGADNLYDIITALGNETGTSAAATSGGFLSDLLALF